MTCSHCGRISAQQARTCNFCGQAFGLSQAEAEMIAAQVVARGMSRQRKPRLIKLIESLLDIFGVMIMTAIRTFMYMVKIITDAL